MRYAGPRMMVRHPILSLAHFFDAVRGKMDKSRIAFAGETGVDKD